jgi:hypothetical protein
MSPHIVVMAHNRPASLERLLRSATAADVAAGTDLLISVDPGGDLQAEVEAVARSVEWLCGELEVRIADRPLGLVAHFEALGDDAARRGDFVLLEDDLEVGPGFHDWSVQALDRYRAEDRVAGISLNALRFNGFTALPFTPMLDGSDAFFAQVPWYQGMVFTAQWWKRWRGFDVSGEADTTDLPSDYSKLGSEEWFGDMARYLASSGRTFVFPRRSHSTNHGEVGVHFDRRSAWFQVPVEQSSATWRLPDLEDSGARYDTWLEFDIGLLRQLVDGLPQGLVVDLTGQRRTAHRLPDSDGLWTLTTNRVQSFEQSWGTARQPLEANVIAGEPGTGVHLSMAAEVRLDRWSLLSADAARRTQSAHGQPRGIRGSVVDAVVRRFPRGWR